MDLSSQMSGMSGNRQRLKSVRDRETDKDYVIDMGQEHLVDIQTYFILGTAHGQFLLSQANFWIHYRLNTSRPRQNVSHCANNIFKVTSLYKMCCILIPISLKFIPKDPINN